MIQLLPDEKGSYLLDLKIRPEKNSLTSDVALNRMLFSDSKLFMKKID